MTGAVGLAVGYGISSGGPDFLLRSPRVSQITSRTWEAQDDAFSAAGICEARTFLQLSAAPQWRHGKASQADPGGEALMGGVEGGLWHL